MNYHNNSGLYQKQLLLRFWASASGFWDGPAAARVWVLTGSLIVIVLAQLLVQYRLNFWNRDFFNALAQLNSKQLWYQAILFIPLAALSIALAIASVWGRMTMQRKWRQWLTTHLIGYWLADGHYRHLDQRTVANHGGHENPEYRISEDARIATDAPVDLAVGLVSSVLSAVVFTQILWSVGGSIEFRPFAVPVRIPGYLVLGVILYSALVTVAMLVVGRPLTGVVQDKNQAEAELRAAANLLRETGEGIAPTGGESDGQRAVWAALRRVLSEWRDLCWQLMRMTMVSQGNILVAPVIALVLCAPKYLAGAMSLGELTQAAAAFATVQTAFNWLVDNYQRLADWASSANRIATLLLAIDDLDKVEQASGKNGKANPVMR
jgi:ABC-type uncharacterized transport system fused permease/ATPase subunit